MFYSQLNQNWGTLKLGTSATDTIGSSGCYMTSWANVANLFNTSTLNPADLNALLITNNGYSDGDALISDVVAKVLGLVYKGSTTTAPDTICIAMTHDHAPKYPTHFYVRFPDNTIIDPLDSAPERKPNTYTDVEYRLFTVAMVSDWAMPAVDWCVQKGIATDWSTPKTIADPVTTETMLYRNGTISACYGTGLTKERMAVLMQKLSPNQ